MEKVKEEKLYHMKSNVCIGYTDETVESFDGADTLNLTWDEFQAIVNPPKSSDELFAEEMDALNANYDKAMSLLANEYNVAVARDGSVETEKVTSIRAKIVALDSQYETDQLAIINKYFGA